MRPTPLPRAQSRLLSTLTAARGVLLCSEFDDTLAPMTSRSSGAEMAEPVRRLLAALHQRPHVHVAMVSGRSLSSVKAQVRLPRLLYVGHHGLEVDGQGCRFRHPRAVRLKAAVDVAHRLLCRELGHMAHVIIDHKGLGCGVHYRSVPKHAHRMLVRRVERLVQPWVRRRQLVLIYSKQAVEVRPRVAWNKGSAVRRLYRRLVPAHERARWRTVFFGDDITDEDVFRVLRARDVRVFVGHRCRETRAAYWARSPQEVAVFLRKLARRLPIRKPAK